MLTHTKQKEQWQWAVQFAGTDMWLNAFETNELAVEYCEINGNMVKEKD